MVSPIGVEYKFVLTPEEVEVFDNMISKPHQELLKQKMEAIARKDFDEVQRLENEEIKLIRTQEKIIEGSQVHQE
ncbi:hypothetical protein [Vibrio phage phiKT1024]|nr:hypothetical protein [Vibrio phage phiKT1024]